MSREIALLLCANPKTFVRGPVVRLGAGSWKLVVKGCINSLLELRVYNDDDTMYSTTFGPSTVIEGPCSASIGVYESSKTDEESISVFARPFISDDFKSDKVEEWFNILAEIEKSSNA